MYNPELEGLIDAALADGVLTEKEKQILFKKAQSMGVDLDEFEMVLDARLVKMKKAEEEKASSAPKSNKFGDVKKCPACGAIVQSYQGVCQECGYAFENIEGNSSSQKLQKMIDSLLEEQLQADKSSENEAALSSVLKSFSTRQLMIETRKEEKIKNAILNFPVPNTKADLMEFIFSLKPKTKSTVGGRYADAYFAKYKECLDKARFMFPNDKDFAPILKANKLGKWGSLSSSAKTLIICLIGVIAFILAGILPMFLTR